MSSVNIKLLNFFFFEQTIQHFSNSFAIYIPYVDINEPKNYNLIIKYPNIWLINCKF